jgi:hypothetical protein
MEVASVKIRIGDGKFVEVDTYRFFSGSKRYKWFDWKSNKKDANAMVKRLRGQGHLARIVPNEEGYSIYTHAQ